MVNSNAIRKISASAEDYMKSLQAFAREHKQELPPSGEVKDTTDVLKVRYVFGVMGLLGIAILYALRVNLSVAIVTMVNITALSTGLEDQSNNYSNVDMCPGKASESSTRYSGEFLWDEEQQGLILAGFFYGYAIGQLPGGMLAERYGGKLVFGLGTVLTAALTVISPFSLWAHEMLFFTVRFLEGLAEGVTFPAMQSMISKWSPPNERSRFSIIFSGSYLGTVICMPLSGFLSDLPLAGGWPLVFYVFGALGVVWYIPWLFLVYDSPEQHPRITEEEKIYIQSSIGATEKKKNLPIPWKAVLSTPGLWACAIMHLGIGWNFFGQITYLPSYMANILHYKIENNAALSAVPYIVGGIASVISSLSLDWIITRKFVTPLTGFKIFNGITGLGAALTLVLIPRAGCSTIWINLLLALNGLSLGAQYAGNGMNLLVLAPNFAGTLYGISNTMANAAGILAPYAVGFLTNGRQNRHQWNIMFYISSAIGLGTYVLYLLLCTDKEQPWNTPQEDVKSTENEEKGTIGNISYINEAYERDIAITPRKWERKISAEIF
ncbi:putative inorganic phosphate cotransporter [Anabrus simplex]|uniref:putative inorganic phosphate cotransporter n=1 Tax=Anabrus simplex TaxID=316456 RepID=UPI0035A2B22D